MSASDESLPLQVHVWLYRVTPLLDAAQLQAAMARLPQWRRDKVWRFKNDADKARSAGAGLLLGHMLARAGLGWDAVLPPHTSDDGGQGSGQGKLHLVAGLGSINLSHAGDLAACVACFGASAPSVGVDVERRERQYHKVLPRVSHAQERAYLETLPSEGERRTAFFDLWTRKEACLKAVGVGLGCDPASLCVMPLNLREVTICYVGSVWQIRSYALAEHALAVCVGQGGLLPDTVQWWEGIQA